MTVAALKLRDQRSAYCWPVGSMLRLERWNYPTVGSVLLDLGSRKHSIHGENKRPLYQSEQSTPVAILPLGTLEYSADEARHRLQHRWGFSTPWPPLLTAPLGPCTPENTLLARYQECFTTEHIVDRPARSC